MKLSLATVKRRLAHARDRLHDKGKDDAHLRVYLEGANDEPTSRRVSQRRAARMAVASQSGPRFGPRKSARGSACARTSQVSCGVPSHRSR
jgi:hypothetical protein